MAKTKVFQSQLAQQPQMFRAYKTASQTAPTTNAQTVVSWNGVEEFNGSGNFSVAGNSWTAPADGWLETTIRLTIDGGSDADDTMTWGVCKNGTFTDSRQYDNWRKFSTGAGVEYPTSLTAAMPVVAGETYTIQFEGTAFGVILIATVGLPLVWVGRFTPSIV